MTTRTALVVAIFIGLLAACNSTAPSPIPATATLPSIPPTAAPLPTTIPSVPPPTTIPEVPAQPTALPMSANQLVLNQSSEILQAFKSQDFTALSTFTHPQSGVRFSPYAFVQQDDMVFSSDQIANIQADSTIYTWGAYSGSGEPISLSFADYYADFIYDVDFVNAPQMSLNHRISGGNSIDNSAEFYPGAMIIEYYFPGFDPQYGGMDWRSLKLVLSENSGEWLLTGVIHDEWTP